MYRANALASLVSAERWAPSRRLAHVLNFSAPVTMNSCGTFAC
jgi:hypothetical protein